MYVMLTPDSVRESVEEFQKRSLCEDVDYSMLSHQKDFLDNKLLQKKYFNKQLLLLYSQLERTRNYQEFVDVLMNNRSLLREIFTLEGQSFTSSLVEPELDLSFKFGIDVQEYINDDDELLALYGDDLL